MTSYVVTEGPADAAFVERVLDERAGRGITVVPAGGNTAVASFAKSLMMRSATALAVVIDADTNEESQVRARERELYDLIKPAAGERPFRVFQAVPEIESVFFAEEMSPFWKEMFGKKPSDIESARRAPKAALRSMTGKNDLKAVIAGLSPSALKALAQTPLFKSLRAFLKKPTKWNPAHSVQY